MKKNVFLDVKNKQKSYFYFDVNIFSWTRKGTKVINAKRMDGHQLFTKKRQKSHPYTQNDICLIWKKRNAVYHIHI
jgi:hypothetical protein